MQHTCTQANKPTLDKILSNTGKRCRMYEKENVPIIFKVSIPCGQLMIVRTSVNCCECNLVLACRPPATPTEARITNFEITNVGYSGHPPAYRITCGLYSPKRLVYSSILTTPLRSTHVEDRIAAGVALLGADWRP